MLADDDNDDCGFWDLIVMIGMFVNFEDYGMVIINEWH